MIYGNYKKARNSAWQCLIDFNVTELPLKILGIAKNSGVKVVKNSEVNSLNGESGKSYINNNQWLIVYNDKESLQRCKFTIAHELGHIFLGHTLKNEQYARTFDLTKSIEETEADIFASRLLAPACVLWGLDLHTPQEIASLCDISLQAAQIRSERMQILYERNKFLASPLERKVYENFKEFIYIKRKIPTSRASTDRDIGKI